MCGAQLLHGYAVRWGPPECLEGRTIGRSAGPCVPSGHASGGDRAVQLVPGEEFGQYVIEAELGRGGQAVVYRARQIGTDRDVALKVFDQLGDASILARFRREAVAAARVDDPRIVTVFESGDVNGVPFIAMRLVPGPSLGELVARVGPLPAQRALVILDDVARAVDAAHQHGLVHRDIKPANVLLDLDDRAYLSDFGVARLDDLPGLTRRGDWLGTVEYVSPEQADGHPATAASDIYAFGVLAFEVLCGRPPFVHRQASAVLVAHVRDEPPPVRSLNPDLPEAVDDAGYVHRLAVPRRGTGQGQRLLGWAAQQVTDRGRSHLRLDCVATNGELRRYYERLGFAYCGDTELFGTPGQRLSTGTPTLVSLFELAVSGPRPPT